MDVSKWPTFSILEPDDIDQIKKVCVFGSSGNEAIYITKDDDVYAIGSNCSGCLGLGDTQSGLEPRKIEALCKKKIVEIAFGSGPHVLAVSDGGDVFSWGHNGYCQLGNGGSVQGIVPVLINSNLPSHKVLKVACGSHHSMALTTEGEIYAWGQNNCGQVGSGTTTNQPTPRKVIAVIGSRVAVSIACGQTSSMALMDNGEVYGWGYNGNGQLGVGNNVNSPNPCKVQMQNGIIVSQDVGLERPHKSGVIVIPSSVKEWCDVANIKANYNSAFTIVCGYAHTLALTDEGALYSWGANSYGQLGTGNKANLVTPSNVSTDGERFIEVAASHYAHISAAMTETGRVYMWGQCRGQSITMPTVTRFACTDDVFAAFSAPAITWRMYIVDSMRGCSVAASIGSAFDDANTSDVKFIVTGKEIHVHKAVLKIRCDYYKSMFSETWDEAGKDTIEISDYSYVVYKAFLRYLYTDRVDLPPDEAIDSNTGAIAQGTIAGLLDLANAYCEMTLKKHCEQIIRQGITVENVAMLYAAAIKFSAKELEDICFRFALNHMTAVTQTEAFAKLDEHVLKELIRKAALNGAFRN